MARIEGVDLPRNKRIEIGLTYIYGIGRSLSSKILETAGVNPDTRVKDLTEAEISKLRDEIDKYQVEGELRREVRANIKRLMDIGSYPVYDIGGDCLFVVSAQRPMPGHARVPRKRLESEGRKLKYNF